MKICFITDDLFEIGGGPEHIRQVAKILHQEKGYAVDVITPLIFNRKFNFQNFCERIGFTFWTIWFYLSSDYDIYHSHNYSTSAFLPLVKLRSKKTGITVHGRGKELVGGGILNKLGIGKLLMWLVLNIWPFDFRFSASDLPGFITVGNGIDLREFGKIRKISHKEFTVLCIARRDPAKGVEVLEKAVQDLKGVKLHLVSGRMRTMTDFAKADVYVLPSLSEGLPIVLLEAMAAKLPIITTNVGQCRKIVEAAGCGLVVTAGDSKQLVEAINAMKKNSKRDKMGENGFKFVKENFSWDKVASFYSSYYRRFSS